MDTPLTLVVAPAGSGKTTELARLAATLDRRTCWYQVDSMATSPNTLLLGLRGALASIGLTDLPQWEDATTAAATLRRLPRQPPTTLFLDDLQVVAGTPAEEALEHLVRQLPGWLRLVAATRRPPECNLPDLFVQGLAVEVDQEVLRWRPWEVERLFRSFYKHRLPPEEAAYLTQRTEGWAAGLQLFHLATRGMPGAGRRALIEQLHTSPGLVRDYLTRNVLVALSRELRRFMIDTCVLGRLDPGLCDALRAADDSAHWLEELRRRRLFLVAGPDGTGHRYHEVLRAYLEVSLLERDGPVATRARHATAARLLEDNGDLAEAVHAYARAEDFDDATRLLGRDGSAVLAEGGPALLEGLPTALVESDPWLQVSRARALLGEGRLGEALDAYRAARAAFGRTPAVATFGHELRALESWVDDRRRPERTATEWLRSALRRAPRRVAAELSGRDASSDLLVAGAAALVAGAVHDARRLLKRVGLNGDTDALPMAIAAALEFVVDLAAGDEPSPDALLWTTEAFERLGVPWLARLARTVLPARADLDPDDVASTWRLVEDDPWGSAILPLASGVVSVCHGDPQPDWLDEAAVTCRTLGATTLEAWALAWGALARVRLGEDARQLAESARELARSIQVPGAEAIADLALGLQGGPGAADAMDRARASAHELGLHLPIQQASLSRVAVVEAAPATVVRCFGGFELTLGGERLDLDGLRPQARVVLAVLALNVPTPVHRDRLAEVLWPGGDPDVTSRRLPVVISTLRRHLEPLAPPGDWSLLVRTGEAHVLRLPDDAWVDVSVFDEAVAAARAAGHERGRLASLQVAFEAWNGELLPEFGPAEWVVGPRDDRRLAFMRVARELARARFAAGDAAGCIDIARAGLQADRYTSELWRLVVAGHRRLGDEAAAARSAREHGRVLAELGVQET